MPYDHNLRSAWLGVLETLDPEVLRPALDSCQGGHWHSLKVKRSFDPAVEVLDDGALFTCGLDATWFCDLQQRNTGMAYIPLHLRLAGTPDAWTVEAVEPFSARKAA